MALLLAKMITASPTERTLIVDPLPGVSRDEKLQGLMTSLGDLEDYRAVLDRRVKDLAELEADGWQDDQGVVRQAIADLAALE